MLLLELPDRLQFNFAHAHANAQVLGSWGGAETTLSEKCRAAVVRILLHYTGVAAQSVQNGRPWYNAVLEFTRVSSALRKQLDTLDQCGNTTNENSLAAVASGLLELELKLLSAPQQTKLVLQPSGPRAWVWDVLDPAFPASGGLSPDVNLLQYATFLDGTVLHNAPSSFSSIALDLISRQIPDESFGFPVYCASHDQVDLKALNKLASLFYNEGSRLVFTPELVAGLKRSNRMGGKNLESTNPRALYHQAMELVALSTLNPGQERYDQLVLELGLLFAAPGNIQIPTQAELSSR